MTVADGVLHVTGERQNSTGDKRYVISDTSHLTTDFLLLFNFLKFVRGILLSWCYSPHTSIDLVCPVSWI